MWTHIFNPEARTWTQTIFRWCARLSLWAQLSPSPRGLATSERVRQKPSPHLSSDASLTRIFVNGDIDAQPEFQSSSSSSYFSYVYNARMNPGAVSLSLMATTNFAAATMKLESPHERVLSSGVETSEIPLTPGAVNEFNIQVLAQDGVTVSRYTLYVTTPLSDDASLSNLQCSTGGASCILLPSFMSSTHDYRIDVKHSTTSITVVATSSHSQAQISFGLSLATTQISSATIHLEVGFITQNVSVSAADGSIQVYQLHITRAGPPELVDIFVSPLADAQCTSAIRKVYMSTEKICALNLSVSSFSLFVNFNVNAVQVAATPRDFVNDVVLINYQQPSSFGLMVISSINLFQGSTTSIVLSLTTSEGVSSYVLNVTQNPPADALLSSLHVNGTRLQPAFTPDTTY